MIDLEKYDKLEFTWEEFEKVFLPHLFLVDLSYLWYQGEKLKVANDHFLKEFGYQEQELYKIDVAVWSHPEERRRFRELLNRAQAGQKVENEDFLIFNGKGEEVKVRLQFGYVAIKDQESVCGCFILKDALPYDTEVTKENGDENIFKAIAEQSLNGIGLINSRFQVVYMNPAGLKIYGFKNLEEAQNVSILSTIAPESLNMLIERSKNWLKGRPKSTKVIYKIRRTDGEIRDLEVMTGTMYLNGVRCHLNTFIDITERKRAEEAIRKTATEWSATFDSMPDLVMLTDRNMQIIRVNKAMVNTLGLHKQEIMGRKCYECVHETNTPHESCPHPQTMADGKEHTAEIFDDKLGKHFFITTTPLHDESDMLTGTVHVMHDITEHKQAEQKILSYQERQRSLASQLSMVEEQERRRIATELHDTVGHLLSVTKIRLTALKESIASPEFDQLLTEVGELIDETVQSTRILTFEISPPILYDVGLEAAVEWLTEQIHERHDILSYLKDDGEPKPLDNEIRVLLFRAVQELLVNVVKHAQATEAKVFLRRDGSTIKIEVVDNGIGFDTSEKRVSDINNMGFGFFSIRDRLDYIGGYMEIESKRGKGTRVILTAPLKLEDEILER